VKPTNQTITIVNRQGFKPTRIKSINVKSVKFEIRMGESHFIAKCVSHAMTTQGKTWLTLMKNIDEITRLHLDIPDEESYNLELNIKPEVIMAMVKKSARAKGC